MSTSLASPDAICRNWEGQHIDPFTHHGPPVQKVARIPGCQVTEGGERKRPALGCPLNGCHRNRVRATAEGSLPLRLETAPGLLNTGNQVIGMRRAGTLGSAGPGDEYKARVNLRRVNLRAALTAKEQARTASSR